MNVKIAGIIAEYNPLHAGHLYHIDETRRRTGCDFIVCALGGCFTQRGDAALFDKYARVEMALLAGADAVFELPAVYASRPAQIFARGGVGILGALGVDVLSFGCETEDLAMLRRARKLISSLDSENRAALTERLSEGVSYPRALSAAASAGCPELKDLLKSPNFVLALEYASEIERAGYTMELCPVKRSAPYHSDAGDVNSASGIRRLLASGGTEEVLRSLPPKIADIYLRELDGGCPDISLLDAHILTLLRETAAESVTCPDEAEGLFTRLASCARASGTYSEALEKTKCRRYTMARIKRLALSAVLGLPEAPDVPPYLRLLGARKEAEPLLKELKRRSGGRVVTRAQLLKNEPVFLAECRASDIWGLATTRYEYRLSGREYKKRFVRVGGEPQ